MSGTDGQPPSFVPRSKQPSADGDGSGPAAPTDRHHELGATRPMRPVPPRSSSSRPPSASGQRPPGAERPQPSSASPAGDRPQAAAHTGRSVVSGGVSPRRPAASSAPQAAAEDRSQPSRTVQGVARRSSPPTSRPTAPVRRRVPRRALRLATTLTVLLLVAALSWPVGLLVWANKQIQHVDALNFAVSAGGVTYLITGSDSRADGSVGEDGTTGARTDTILLLHKPIDGPAALISIPRDTYVVIDGYGPAKINAAYSWGGPSLLIDTVEELTGLTVDHYAEIGMGGVANIVDAVGGVNLCWDADVNDHDSGMVWTAGCHDVDGTAALAFSRMRKSDPTGDIGRGLRQRQVVGAVMAKVDPATLVWHPTQQVALIKAGTAALTVDNDTSIIDLAQMALAFKEANGPQGITGAPPLASLDYRPGGVGSTVLIDPDTAAQFWTDIRDGNFTPGTVVGGIGS